MKRRGKKQKMRIEDKILGLLKEKQLAVGDLQVKLQLSNVKARSTLTFLRKYGLIEEMVIAGDTVVKITAMGLQLLNLPNLPEDETTSPSEFSEDTVKWIREREDKRQRKIAGGENIK